MLKSKLRSLVLTAFFSVAIAGCSSLSGGKHKGNKSDKTLQYQYEQNGCNTGIHTFKSLEALCSGLLNESLNKGCALSMREEHYKRDCDSTYSKNSGTPTGDSPSPDFQRPKSGNSQSSTPSNNKPIVYDYNFVYIEAPTSIAFVSKTPFPEVDGYFTWKYRLTIAKWTTKYEGEFKESIDFEAGGNNSLRISGSSHCDEGETTGKLSPSGDSVLDVTVEGTALCAADLKNGLFYLQGHELTTQSLKKVKQVLISLDKL